MFRYSAPSKRLAQLLKDGKIHHRTSQHPRQIPFIFAAVTASSLANGLALSENRLLSVFDCGSCAGFAWSKHAKRALLLFIELHSDAALAREGTGSRTINASARFFIVFHYLPNKATFFVARFTACIADPTAPRFGEDTLFRTSSIKSDRAVRKRRRLARSFSVCRPTATIADSICFYSNHHASISISGALGLRSNSRRSRRFKIFIFLPLLLRARLAYHQTSSDRQQGFLPATTTSRHFGYDD